MKGVSFKIDTDEACEGLDNVELIGHMELIHHDLRVMIDGADKGIFTRNNSP